MATKKCSNPFPEMEGNIIVVDYKERIIFRIFGPIKLIYGGLNIGKGMGDAIGGGGGGKGDGDESGSSENGDDGEKNGSENIDDDTGNYKFPANNFQIKHIFRNAEGHLPDTASNRNLLLITANTKSNYLGSDKYGNDWYAKTQADGTQVWVETRNGIIINGGLNKAPKSYNPDTGLKSLIGKIKEIWRNIL